MSSTTLPKHPHLRGTPLPSSAQLPSLTAKLAYFKMTHENLLSNYPYETSSSSGKKPGAKVFHIPYCEISGCGPPPKDLVGTQLGDIYIDVTPGRNALYGKISDSHPCWKQWYDPHPRHKTEENTVRHPHFDDRLLWCSDARGVSWFVPTTVTSNSQRARKNGFVSSSPQKSETEKAREASMLIQLSLAEAKRQREKGPSHGPTDPKSTTSPLSSPELSPEPVLGKRKTRGSGAGNVSLDTAESKRYKLLLERSIQQLKDDKQQLVEEIRVLEKQLASQPQLTVAEPKLLEWTNEIVRDGIRMRRQDMNESVREYWDLKTELAADEEQLRVEAKLLEDAQMNLGLAIAQQRLKQIIPVK